jgi:PAS domain S-box-containing protein
MDMKNFPLSLVYEADIYGMVKLFKGMLQRSSGNDVEFRIRCKNGDLKWVSMSWQSIYDDKGTSLGYRSSIRDIVSRKQAEKALQEAEEKYRNIFENSVEGLYRVNPEGHFVTVNPAAASILGYESPEELMTTITDISSQIYAYPEDREKALNMLKKEGFFKNLEVRNRKKDGSIVWVSANVHLVRDNQGNILYHEGTSHDITSRIQAEAELKQHRNNLEQLVKEKTAELMRTNENLQQEIAERKKIQEMLGGILDSVKDHMSMVDNDYNILWMNNTAKQLFGEHILGKKCYAVYRGRKTRCNNCVITKTFQDGQVHEQEIEITNATGNTLFLWSTFAVASRYSDGRVRAVLEISRDITERKLAEMAIKKSKENLEAKSKTLEELNTTLRVLLHQREEDKKDLEDRVVSNVKRLVIPYIEKMKKNHLDPQQLSNLNILEANLNEIVSPFLHTVRQLNLTPRETQVASLIKDGKTTKEVAETIGVGISAVDSYRNSIRAKLGLNNKKVNLQSYLQSLK